MKIGDDMPENQEQFKNLLKQNGLKVTTQRVAILEVLDCRPGKHLTAEEIYDYVREKFPEIGIATVYRTIQVLSELNLIDKLNLDDGYVRYEISKGSKEETSHHHHHLICLDCGNVYAFQDDLLETLEERIMETMGFQVVDHEVKLYGHCKACRANKSIGI
jgi:Fur family ferric uptake transcriptional regulator